ncbi:hypothetical protein J6590_007041 [Homalodisca vitripennis]|nr:hypothetical protein J6590_007041 [Homalodisca vitripennis]
MGRNGRRMRHRDWTIPLRVGGRYEAARARVDMGGHTSVQSLSSQHRACRSGSSVQGWWPTPDVQVFGLRP